MIFSDTNCSIPWLHSMMGHKTFASVQQIMSSWAHQLWHSSETCLAGFVLQFCFQYLSGIVLRSEFTPFTLHKSDAISARVSNWLGARTGRIVTSTYNSKCLWFFNWLEPVVLDNVTRPAKREFSILGKLMPLGNCKLKITHSTWPGHSARVLFRTKEVHIIAFCPSLRTKCILWINHLWLHWLNIVLFERHKREGRFHYLVHEVGSWKSPLLSFSFCC